ncbi:MAG: hypothetical protein ACQETF_12635 [Bacteroidota bacterium]
MHKHLSTIAIIFISIFLQASCSDGFEPIPPNTKSNVLNELARSVPFQYLNIDKLKTQGVNLNDEDIIYSLNIDSLKNDPSFGQFTRFAKFKDQFYVYDSVVSSIFIIDLDGIVKGPLTKQGRGPGEHGNIQNLKANDQYIFASDEINGRVNYYTHEMIPAGQIVDLSNFLDINNTRILLHNQNSTGISPINPEEGLIVISLIDNLTDTLSTILPRIVPENLQPQIFNMSRASINNQNSFVLNYYFLPWLIIYENSIHTRTLILNYSMFDEMDIPLLEFFEQLDNQGFGGVKPITKFKLLDNGDILFSIRTELFYLVRSSLDSTYQLTGKYQFYPPHGDSPLWISDFFPSENKNEIFVGSWEYLFRVDL